MWLKLPHELLFQPATNVTLQIIAGRLCVENCILLWPKEWLPERQIAVRFQEHSLWPLLRIPAKCLAFPAAQGWRSPLHGRQHSRHCFFPAASHALPSRTVGSPLSGLFNIKKCQLLPHVRGFKSQWRFFDLPILVYKVLTYLGVKFSSAIFDSKPWYLSLMQELALPDFMGINHVLNWRIWSVLACENWCKGFFLP